MTTVILLMWLSDIAGALQVLGVLSLIAFSFGVTGAAIFAAMEDEIEMFKKPVRYLRWLVVPIVVAGICPSQNTIRLIAASEAVDVAADTKLGQKAISTIEALLTKVENEAKK